MQKNLTYAGKRAMIVYELPLAEVVFDFYDKLSQLQVVMPALIMSLKSIKWLVKVRI